MRDAEAERGPGRGGAIGWRGRDLAQRAVLLVLFLLLIGRQQYLDRARLFTGGQKTGEGISQQPAAWRWGYGGEGGRKNNTEQL